MKLRAFAVVTLSIAIPLTATSIGLDAHVLALGGGVAVVVGFAALAWSFERFRTAARKTIGLFQGTFTQSLTASSLTLIFGTAGALTWSSGLFPRLIFSAAALISVNWWFHVLAKTKVISSQRESRSRKQELEKLRDQIATLMPAGEENDRLRAVVQHVINVLVSLEKAKEGQMGLDELSPEDWIEHKCLRSTRDVLARATGAENYRIELGILRVPNEVVYVDMAAGKLLRQYKEQSGCPLDCAPDQKAIEEILRRKEREGGFTDSRAVEFELHGEPHYMVALSTAEFDEIDGEMLALIGAMFVVLKLALEA
ncbi:MAG TPA: hypothetical protein VFX44_05520 [Solirubrobacterales bacterium]|nr:hypothetical protein [Solirubrobacterales bacterium]